jgi:hypothetical protein
VKVVIDTNIFISSFLGAHTPPRKIIDIWKKEKLILCISNDILEEYIEVFSRLKTVKEQAKAIIAIMHYRRSCLFILPKISINAIENDPSDNKFLECAVESKAQYIISGDKHLLALKEFRSIEIVGAKDFLKLIKLL